MKRNTVLIFILAASLAACASEKPKEQPKPQTPAAEAPQAPAAEVPKPVEPVAVDPLDDPNNILARRSTYYPFDVSVIQHDDLPLVQAHAKYLSEHPDRKIRLEGNCDERGSTEYNLGLGQRRADGVKKALLTGGAKVSQIETGSNGEEKPRLTCHEEKCWKENRRTDLVYEK